MDHNNKQMKWMMWMMMLCCAVPLVAVLFFGIGGSALGVPTWLIIGFIVIMIIAHFFMMRGHHGHSGDDSGKDNASSGKDDIR